jgi:uncharacterized protein YbaR (Trm112 family)
MKYICPLCKTPLTEKHFHDVIKIQEKKEKVQKGEVEKLRKEALVQKEAAAQAKRQVKEAKQKAKQAELEGHKKGQEFAKKKYDRMIHSQNSTIKKLKEKNQQLKQGTTPQEIGLADEKVLVGRLEKEFPDDEIKHEGKEGDVLHFVKFNKEISGCIVYECKHTDRIAAAHIEQIASDKKTRQANYGILVTTGTRKGFSGLDQESGVFIVAQAGVLTLARICRESLVKMAEQRLDAAEKEAAAKRLMDYVTSPACKTPLEEAISQTERAHRNLVKEIQQHIGGWRERHEVYETIRYDVSHIQQNVDRVLNGKEPLKLEKPRFEPLALENKI